MFYIILLLLVINELFKKDDYKIIFLIITIMSAIRYGIGNDYFAYKYLFYINDDNLKQVIFNPTLDLEVGYRIISYIFKITTSYEVFIAVVAIITSFFVIKFITDYSIDYNLSITIYYCMFYLNYTYSGIRQGITLALGSYFFMKIKNKKKLYFVLMLLTSIHKSVLIIIIFDILSNLNFTRKSFFILVFTGLLFSISGISNYFPTPIRNYYYFSEINILDISIIFKRILRFVLFLIIYMNHNIFEEYGLSRIRNFFYWSVIIYYTISFFETFAARLMIYGQFMLIILIPIIFKYNKKRSSTVLKTFIISMLCLIFYKDSVVSWNTITNGYSNSAYYMPYVNIYNKEKYEKFFYMNRHNVLLE